MTRFFGAAWLVANQRGRVRSAVAPISRWVIAAGVAIWALGSAAPGFAQCFPIAGAEPELVPATFEQAALPAGTAG